MTNGVSRAFPADTDLDEVLAQTAEFATGEYATFLLRGAAAPTAQREQVVNRLSDMIGLPADLVARAEGRVSMVKFVRHLLRDEGKVLGLYDTTVTASDPFPDRDEFAWPDPTLSGISPVYTMAVNRLLRSEIGLDTDREYILLSMEVNKAWKNDARNHAFDPALPGATDDFRYGMALNPNLKAFVTHGVHDLVTPFHTSDRLRQLMRLDPATGDRLTVRRFGGGHMFYAREESRTAFTTAIADFVARAL